MLQNFVQSAETELSLSLQSLPPIDVWAPSIKLPGGPFTFSGHEYLRDVLKDPSRRTVLKKGAQLGFSESQIFKSLHGMIDGRLPAGCLYLFPTDKDVSDFSRARFTPLLTDNPELAKEVHDTDSIGLKRIRKAMLYLRGARVTTKIEGQRKMSTQLLSIPVDRVVFDERDNMDDDMIDLALERLGHSKIQEEAYLGTPSFPDYGVSKLYEESDHRVWEIKCAHCGAGTILELEFPACILEVAPDRFIRACRKCKLEIFPKDGQWITLNPSQKDLAGYWISRLNSPYLDLKKILKIFNDPAKRKHQELYNSTLALPYVATENRLTTTDVFARCGQDIMAMQHPGPCAMGVDVGRDLHVVIGYRKTEFHSQLIKIVRISSFNDLQTLMDKFGVARCVIDCEPETRKAREFAEANPWGRVWLCDYQDTLVNGPLWDEPRRLVKAQRTEVSDASHDLISNSLIQIPHKNEEVELFAKQCSSMARILLEDKESGSRTYVYRSMGEDHYRHALNYFWIAAKKVAVIEEDTPAKRLLRLVGDKEQEDYNPLTFGLKFAK